MSTLRDRHAARLLVIDAADRLLLFRFDPGDRPPFWATAGGECEAGESYEDAAQRELLEETGIAAEPGEAIDARDSIFVTFEGEKVHAVERYFAIRVAETEIDVSGHSDMERRAMREYRWWTADELAACEERYYPPDLPDLFARQRENAA